MSDQNKIQHKKSRKDSEPSSNGAQTWTERNFAVLFGGGAFALLAAITVMMYFVSN